MQFAGFVFGWQPALTVDVHYLNALEARVFVRQVITHYRKYTNKRTTLTLVVGAGGHSKTGPRGGVLPVAVRKQVPTNSRLIRIQIARHTSVPPF